MFASASDFQYCLAKLIFYFFPNSGPAKERVLYMYVFFDKNIHEKHNSLVLKIIFKLQLYM